MRMTESERIALKERARKLLDEGKEREEVAETLGVADSTLVTWFPELLKFHRTELARKRRERAVEMEAEGYTRQQIADELGISRSRVAQIVGNMPAKHDADTVEVKLRLGERARARLEEIAREQNALAHRGPSVGDPSISVLLDKIAAGELVIRPA